jgi:hypothetical protein
MIVDWLCTRRLREMEELARASPSSFRGLVRYPKASSPLWNKSVHQLVKFTIHHTSTLLLDYLFSYSGTASSDTQTVPSRGCVAFLSPQLAGTGLSRRILRPKHKSLHLIEHSRHGVWVLEHALLLLRQLFAWESHVSYSRNAVQSVLFPSRVQLGGGAVQKPRHRCRCWRWWSWPAGLRSRDQLVYEVALRADMEICICERRYECFDEMIFFNISIQTIELDVFCIYDFLSTNFKQRCSVLIF